MLTLESLREYGANVEEGMSRCLNDESFYMRLVKMAADEEKFEKLPAAVESGDLDAGFELAHGLKGIIGNLSLTPLYDPICEITELLRSRTETDYSELLETIRKKHEELKSML